MSETNTPNKYENRWRSKYPNSKIADKSWKVMLRACLPEHEGNDSVYMTFDTQAEANHWVGEQNGFYKSGDFYVRDPYIALYAASQADPSLPK